ncbi:hypothetical protein SAY86_017843 [Trapa natans]|uniref:Uncharacterized protein n=1 Tax=Trapa natans TaxID=22666 RepID=A0AAN7LRZ3_TRANT|nr:hypothetical protein SAY86_017843 [Trapa natans]
MFLFRNKHIIIDLGTGNGVQRCKLLAGRPDYLQVCAVQYPQCFGAKKISSMPIFSLLCHTLGKKCISLKILKVSQFLTSFGCTSSSVLIYAFL